jgi:hypothetical protein
MKNGYGNVINKGKINTNHRNIYSTFTLFTKEEEAFGVLLVMNEYFA